MFVATTTASAVAVPPAVCTDTGSWPVTRRTRVPSTSVPPCARRSAAMAASSSMGSTWLWSSSRTAPRVSNGSSGVSTHATGSPACWATASSARAAVSPRSLTAKVYAARFCSATPCCSQ